MNTLTVELSDDLAARLAAASEARRTAPEQIVRDLLASALVPPQDGGLNALDGLHDLVGCVDSGVTDLATNPKHLAGLGQWRR